MANTERMVKLSDQFSPPDKPDKPSNTGNQKYTDQTIICRDCSGEFVWTKGEQIFYAEKELFPPKRCKGCAAHKRALG